jgi:GNAT superfamily N-acetyltransferase
MQRSVEIVVADLAREDHQQAVVNLTAAYALDTMGNGAPLPGEVLDRLIPGLRAHPTTLILLAYVDGQPVGIATCFLGFSTFYARPILNIHDLAVLPGFRGHGIGRQLLEAVGDEARKRGCCKLTLEVLEGNTVAKRLYEAVGFAQAVYTGSSGGALFYTKALECDRRHEIEG